MRTKVYTMGASNEDNASAALDIENLLLELSSQEKIDLLAGTVNTLQSSFSHFRKMLSDSSYTNEHLQQELTFGIRKAFPD